MVESFRTPQPNTDGNTSTLGMPSIGISLLLFTLIFSLEEAVNQSKTQALYVSWFGPRMKISVITDILVFRFYGYIDGYFGKKYRLT